MEKASLYKFTLILLLKNDVQLKQKSGKQSKNIITQIYYKKKKIMCRKKKSRLKKKKKSY